MLCFEINGHPLVAMGKTIVVAFCRGSPIRRDVTCSCIACNVKEETIRSLRQGRSHRHSKPPATYDLQYKRIRFLASLL